MSDSKNSAANLKIVTDFVDAFNRQDADGIMALMSDDCVFESSAPAPDGGRFVGAADVRKQWDALFKNRPDAFFEEEESFVSEDRAFARWKLKWTGENGPQYVRGIDIMRIKDGKITEKLTYSKK